MSDNVSLDTVVDGTLDRVANVAPGFAVSYTFDPSTIDEPGERITPEQRAHDNLVTMLACAAALPYHDIRKLSELFMYFAKLTRIEWDIVSCFLNGGTEADYATKHKLTKQTAHARIMCLFRRMPIFKAIANGGLTHGTGGRKAAPREYTQPDLFGLEGC